MRNLCEIKIPRAFGTRNDNLNVDFIFSTAYNRNLYRWQVIPRKCFYFYGISNSLGKDFFDVSSGWDRNKKGPSPKTLGLLAVRGSHNPYVADLPVSILNLLLLISITTHMPSFGWKPLFCLLNKFYATRFYAYWDCRKNPKSEVARSIGFHDLGERAKYKFEIRIAITKMGTACWSCWRKNFEITHLLSGEGMFLS